MATSAVRRTLPRMPRRPLDADTLLGVHLDAICSRNCYTKDPQPVIDELLKVAGERLDLLAKNVGTWAGFWERDPNVRPLALALQQRIPGASDWVELGRSRASSPAHGTGGIHAPRTTEAPGRHP
jgi:hypothetical protein